MMTSIFKQWNGIPDLDHIISGSIIDTPKMLLEARAICDKYKINEVFISFARSSLMGKSSKIYPVLVFANEDERNSCYNALEDIPKTISFSKRPFPDMEDLKNVLKQRKVTLTRAVECSQIYTFNDFSESALELTDYGLEVWLFAKNSFHNPVFFYDEQYFLFEDAGDAAMLEGYLTANPVKVNIDSASMQQVGTSTKTFISNGTPSPMYIANPGGAGGGNSGNVLVTKKY